MLYIYPYKTGSRLSKLHFKGVSKIIIIYQLSVNWIRSRNQLTNTDFSSPSLRNENIALYSWKNESKKGWDLDARKNCNLEQNINILNITFNNFSTVYTQQHAINIIWM